MIFLRAFAPFGMFVIGALTGLLLGVVLHELGHYVGGRLTGYRFVSFRVLKWLWARGGHGKLKFTTSPGVVLGQCLMEPPDDEATFRFMLYNVGGVLANFITAAACFVPMLFVPRESIWWDFLLAWFVMNLVMGITNIVPIKKLTNDGANIQQARKSAQGKRALYIMLKANAEMTKGRRQIDFDDDFFVFDGTPDVSNYLVAHIMLLRASQLEEQGHYDPSYQILLRMERDPKLPVVISAQLQLNLLYHELVLFGDDEALVRGRARMAAQENNKMFMQLLTAKAPAFLPYQAMKSALLDGDTPKAQQLMEQARTLAPTMQNAGLEYSIELMLKRTEERMAQQK